MSKITNNVALTYLKLIKTHTMFENCLKKVNFLEAKDGYCKAELKVEQEHTNFFGNLHGGLSATLVDVVSGVALITHKSEGKGVSVAMNMLYLKGAKIGDDVVIEAKTMKAGKSLAYLEVELKNKISGEILVTGTHTKFIG